MNSARDALQRGGEYNDVCVAYTMYSRGDTEAECVDGRKVVFSRRHSDGPIFDILDRVLSVEGAANDERLLALQRATLGAVSFGKRHSISVDTKAVRGAMRAERELGNASYRLPEDWRYAGLSIDELRKFWDALRLIARTFIVTKATKPCAGSLDALVVLRYSDALKSLRVLTGLPQAEVKRLVDFHCVGVGTGEDLAHTPLVRAGPSFIVASPHMLLSSSFERNFYAALLRRDKKVVENQAHQLPAHMAAELAEHFVSLGFVCRTGVGISNALGSTDIDLLVYSQDDDFLVTVELKWMYAAGDLKDVYNRDADAMKALNKQLPLHREQLSTAKAMLGEVLGVDVANCDSASILIMRDYVGSNRLPKTFGWADERVLRDLIEGTPKPSLRDVVGRIESFEYVERYVSGYSAGQECIELLGGFSIEVPGYRLPR